MHSNALRMEPFYQLSRSGGALAQHSITLNYLDNVSALVLVFALRNKHWVVLCSSLLYVAASMVLPILASSAILITLPGDCSVNVTDRSHGIPSLVVHPTIARFLEAIICFTGLALIFFILMLRKRKKVLHADPGSLASLAALFSGHPLLEVLRGIDPTASSTVLGEKLRHGRCRLAAVQSDALIQTTDLSLTMNHSAVSKRPVAVEPFVSKPSCISVDAPKHCDPKLQRQFLFQKLGIALFALFLTGLVVLILWYLTHGEDTGFERLMDSESTGVKAMMASFGVLIKLYWLRIEQVAQTFEPYLKLSKGNAQPCRSILVTTSYNTFERFVQSLKRRDSYVSTVAFSAILADVLIILLPAVPYKPTTTHKAFLVSTCMSLVILFVMIFTIVWVFFRSKMMTLPRSPTTIASTLSYICASRFIDDFGGMRGMNGKELHDAVESLGKTYTFGWMAGVDGLHRWAVDEDEEVDA
ncbi:hypothetical protein K402DRAFT_105430 [Aulographum hederae CBS 113979]|uniref:Uncharacterized protein n=1 Tax=Aulographum hederae CBS 113979 TaxID=1176131 RepID=A0A6G1GXX5_9PEZI|nr:hypothetical protein K402DRAFT_105430 [Aulographum hederae CBS 113979]